MTKELSRGNIAPDFTLQSLEGETFRLSDLRGRCVLIAFLRNAQCALCNLWIHETTVRYESWKKLGLSVVAVFESSAEKLRAQFNGRVPPFPVLADPDGSIHELFGSYNDPDTVNRIVQTGEAEPALQNAAAAGFKPIQEEGANFFRIPTEMVLDREGNVAWFHRADRVTNHLDPEVIETLVRTLENHETLRSFRGESL